MHLLCNDIMIKPESLKKGDKVGVVAPSSPALKERIVSGIKFLEDLGFDVVVGESVYSEHGFFSGSDEVRAKDINKMFCDNTIRGIFAIRGGYGCARILDLLDYKMIHKNPKCFFGYSDITAIHNALNQRSKLITYHTPMICSEFYEATDEYTKKSFLDLIFDGCPLGCISNPDGYSIKSLYGGIAKGQLCGGNLSVIVASLGTKYEINTKGKILFIEDVDEPLYKIDRMIFQLKQSKKLKNANGIILGSFYNCKSKDVTKSLSLNEIFEELILPEKKPTLTNVMMGHLLPSMSLPLGSKFFINADENKLIHLGN